jgi:NADH:ubiquinone oxidoreductase subunit F (NADH-binding)
VPRLRPPYVAQVGPFGRPTLEHNRETLYWVRDVVERVPRIGSPGTGGAAARACARSRSRAG